MAIKEIESVQRTNVAQVKPAGEGSPGISTLSRLANATLEGLVQEWTSWETPQMVMGAASRLAWSDGAADKMLAEKLLARLAPTLERVDYVVDTNTPANGEKAAAALEDHAGFITGRLAKRLLPALSRDRNLQLYAGYVTDADPEVEMGGQFLLVVDGKNQQAALLVDGDIWEGI